MSRLVVVSNRVADPRKTAAGGLAVALAEVLNNTGGMWFGWSGKVIEVEHGGVAGEGELHTHQAGPVKLVTVDLSREDHDSYYAGYSNGVLWPVFHYRLDLADFDAGYIAGYRRVNQMFARKLLPLLNPDDIIWVHDYHLIPLAGVQPLGAGQRLSDRHRCAGIRGADPGPGRPRHVRADEERILAAQAAGGRRPARLLQGPATPDAGFPRAARQVSRDPQDRDVDPDRLAEPRGRDCLQRHPARARKPVWIDQR